MTPTTTYARTTGSYHRQCGPKRDPRIISNQGDAVVEGGNSDGRPEGWKGSGDGEQDYAEQLVLFDYLTASLLEVLGPTCAPSETAAIFAVAEASLSTLGSLTEEHLLYHRIQHSKNSHPDFDPVLRGVLQSVPAAKILLTAGNKVCFQWDQGGEFGTLLFDESSSLAL